MNKLQASSPGGEGLQRRQDTPPEVQQRIQEELANRQAWPTYQEMLVSALHLNGGLTAHLPHP